MSVSSASSSIETTRPIRLTWRYQLLLVEHGQRCTRISCAENRSRSLARFHVQQYAAVLPVVPRRNRVRRTVGAERRDHGRVRTREKLVDVGRNRDTAASRKPTTAGTEAARSGSCRLGRSRKSRTSRTEIDDHGRHDDPDRRRSSRYVELPMTLAPAQPAIAYPSGRKVMDAHPAVGAHAAQLLGRDCLLRGPVS